MTPHSTPHGPVTHSGPGVYTHGGSTHVGSTHGGGYTHSGGGFRHGRPVVERRVHGGYVERTYSRHGPPTPATTARITIAASSSTPIVRADSLVRGSTAGWTLPGPTA